MKSKYIMLISFIVGNLLILSLMFRLPGYLAVIGIILMCPYNVYLFLRFKLIWFILTACSLANMAFDSSTHGLLHDILNILTVYVLINFGSVIIVSKLYFLLGLHTYNPFTDKDLNN